MVALTPDHPTPTPDPLDGPVSSGRATLPRLLAFLPLVTMAGCSAPPSWLVLPWDIIRFSIGTVLRWGLLSAVLGLFVAVGAFLILRAVRGYQWGWRHATWFRLAALILMVAVLPPLFGIAGALHGAYVAADTILTKYDAVNDVYAAVGGVGADVIAVVYIASPQLSGAAGNLEVDAITLAELDGFRGGRWEIRVSELKARLTGTSDDILQAVAERLGREARERVPALKTGLGDWVLSTSLDRILLPALKSAARGRVSGAAISAASGAFLEGVADAARSHGSPDTIGRRDLSSHLVRRWIVGPLLLDPLRSLIRGVELTVWVVICVVLARPVLFFQVAHAIWRAVSDPGPCRDGNAGAA